VLGEALAAAEDSAGLAAATDGECVVQRTMHCMHVVLQLAYFVSRGVLR
jgi:hypothetical protein